MSIDIFGGLLIAATLPGTQMGESCVKARYPGSSMGTYQIVRLDTCARVERGRRLLFQFLCILGGSWKSRQ
jgi:hypothetical protein